MPFILVQRKSSTAKGWDYTNLIPASLKESITAFTLPWYFWSLFNTTETAGISLTIRRSPRILPIFAAAATSLVDSMLGRNAFSCELAAEATVAVGEWITWADTYLFVKCIFKRYGLRNFVSFSGRTGGGITISVSRIKHQLYNDAKSNIHSSKTIHNTSYGLQRVSEMDFSESKLGPVSGESNSVWSFFPVFENQIIDSVPYFQRPKPAG